MLVLNRNNITELPQYIFSLENLEVLCAIHNRITVLPKSIALFYGLRELHLDSNYLNELPTEPWSSMRELRVLSLSKNHLSMLPDTIGFILKLRVLQIEDNHIEFLPTSIHNLRHLAILKASNNSLTTLPQSLGTSWSPPPFPIPGLSHFLPFCLFLSSINCTCTGTMVGLRSLDIKGNPLETLPLSLGKLKKLGR